MVSWSDALVTLHHDQGGHANLTGCLSPVWGALPYRIGLNGLVAID